MELSKQIGQMIMIGLEGDELTSGERRLLRDFPVGGFILFSHNLKEPQRIVSLCRSLWRTGREINPFIAIDQEGGRVHRLPPPFTHFPPAAALGRTASADLACRAGLAMAREINAAGINLNFAPVLDVNSNPSNPVIGDRALGSDPDEVTRLGWEVVRGLRAGGVIPCVKHFPGHGDTAQDSHLELPVVQKKLDELKSVELPPFVHACRNQVETMMTAHVVYPALDAEHPATLSRHIVGGLLREELQYDGVVFSDDLEMKAISANYSVDEAVRLAVLAGVDVLLFGHEIEKAVAAFDFLCREFERSEALRERVEESCGRIRELKSQALAGLASEGKLASCIGESEKIVAEIHGSR
ncbi:MAG TPA: beta-N-acetylhexosaminidase [Candidatus Binatia bacterium]|jgi:beta-N-acetylhexosaminidase